MKTEELMRRKLQSLYLAGEREILRERSVRPRTPTKLEYPTTPPAYTALSTPARAEALLELQEKTMGNCQRCRLATQRRYIVFGTGAPHASLFFIGEAPGRDEDLQGEPFVGQAGQLLTKIIEAMHLKRADVYIANVVKCRPPDNRNPAPDEIAACEPFLLRQIEIVQPKAIVALGNFAVQTLLQSEAKITALRGRFHPWPSKVVKNRFETSLQEGSIQLMPTYHPAFLLRNPNMKRAVWEDMQKVMALLKT